MKRKRQAVKAFKLCRYKLTVGYDIGKDFHCEVLMLWGKGFCRVLKTIIVPEV